MSFVNGYVIICLLVTLVYFAGLLTYLTDHEENKCEMTYMFEYPQFVRISNKADGRYPKYGLYAYSEGRMTQKTRDMYFDGIPVLFLPGNGGSEKQVRSLASIALRKALNSRTSYHFDYFTIDLNDELSGLNGAVLHDQMNYVNHSIERILELYAPRKNPPRSIVLIGHSMGGILATHLVASFGPHSNLVSMVLTLASPHRRPPVALDVYLHQFYKDIKNKGSRNPQSNVTFISLGGGYDDLLVPSYLTKIESNTSLNVETTHIPLVWVPTDHLCILWCKQLILVLNRALFDSVDPKTGQISSDPHHRYSMFRHHLVHHSGISSRLVNNYEGTVKVNNDGEWFESIQRQYTHQLNQGVRQARWYMVRLVQQPNHEGLTVVAVNLETVDWVFACGAHIPRGQNRVCEEFTRLTQLSEISASAKYKRRTIRLNMHEVMKSDSALTHIVFRTLATSEPVIFHVDIYNMNERKKQVELPHVLSLKESTLIEETAEKAISYDLEMGQLQHVIQSYQLHVDAIKCSGEYRHATASLIVPWGNQNYHKHFTEIDTKPLHVRLYDSKPKGFNQSATVRLTLDPTCRYRISIKSSIPGMIVQMARFYSPLLVANIAVVILMTFGGQLKNLELHKRCSLFFSALKDEAKPYYVVTGVKILSKFLGASMVTAVVAAPDYLILSADGMDFFLLPLLLFLCSVGIVWILGILLGVSLVVFETTVHKLALKFLARTVSFTVNWSDYVMSALHKVPFVVAGTLICLSMATSGALALAIGMVFYFLRLIQMSQDYVEELVWYCIKKLSAKFKKRKRPTVDEQNNEQPRAVTDTNKAVVDDNDDKNKEQLDKKDDKPENNNNNNNLETKFIDAQNAMFFHATIFMIWTLLTLINVPSALTWAHNFKHSPILRPDPAFFPGFVLSLCALPLWQLELPKTELKNYKEIGFVVTAMAVLSLLYAPISIYRLNYTLTSVIVVVTLHQVLGKHREEAAPSGSRGDDEGHVSYASVKAKLE